MPPHKAFMNHGPPTTPSRRDFLVATAMGVTTMLTAHADGASPATVPAAPAVTVARRYSKTARHRTAYLDAGPADGPLMLLLHGWPEIGVVWRRQIDHFAAAGWRCVAPDLRGYGRSDVPTEIGAYAHREIVHDLLELHDALSPGRPAVWVAHDVGCYVNWAIAARHAERVRGTANLCVPYFSRGYTIENRLPLIDRTTYPADKYPVGQWDYQLYYRENFSQAAADFGADVPATIASTFRGGSPDAVGKPAATADVRARGGFYGSRRRAPAMTRDERVLSQDDFDTLVAAFRATGFEGSIAWYLNQEANQVFTAEAPNWGRITVPALFFHAAWDTTSYSAKGRLADPMRADCDDLTEVTIDGGHSLMMERPDEVNAAIGRWLAAKKIG